MFCVFKGRWKLDLWGEEIEETVELSVALSDPKPYGKLGIVVMTKLHPVEAVFCCVSHGSPQCDTFLVHKIDGFQCQ